MNSVQDSVQVNEKQTNKCWVNHGNLLTVVKYKYNLVKSEEKYNSEDKTLTC